MKEIKYNNFDWYIIKEENDEVTLLMKDILSEDIISKYWEDNMISNYTKYYVRYHYDIRNNDWRDSYMRDRLNNYFINEFNKEDLVLMDDDYIRLLTKEEAEELDTDVRSFNEYYWTMTPAFFYGIALVGYVGSDGLLNSNDVSDSGAVRPVIKLKAKTLNTKEQKNAPSFFEEKLRELERRIKVLENER